MASFREGTSTHLILTLVPLCPPACFFDSNQDSSRSRLRTSNARLNEAGWRSSGANPAGTQLSAANSLLCSNTDNRSACLECSARCSDRRGPAVVTRKAHRTTTSPCGILVPGGRSYPSELCLGVQGTRPQATSSLAVSSILSNRSMRNNRQHQLKKCDELVREAT